MYNEFAEKKPDDKIFEFEDENKMILSVIDQGSGIKAED